MNDVIYETVISTVAPDGTPHVAPMGVRYRRTEAGTDAGIDAATNTRSDVILMPFKPSTTLANIVANRHAVLNIVADTRVFAGAVTGRRSWPLRPTERIEGVRLSCALNHVELELAELNDDPQRPVLRMARVFEASHAPYIGFNRAQAAVIEGAILVSRLRMLAAEKVDAEMAYLQIAIDKTAGPEEHEAWGWLTEAVARHRATAQEPTQEKQP